MKKNIKKASQFKKTGQKPRVRNKRNARRFFFCSVGVSVYFGFQIFLRFSVRFWVVFFQSNFMLSLMKGAFYILNLITINLVAVS